MALERPSVVFAMSLFYWSFDDAFSLGPSRVDQCPITANEWKLRGEKMKCPQENNITYHCILDKEGDLQEICMQKSLFNLNGGACPWISKAPNGEILFGHPLTTCNVSGCPDKEKEESFYSDEIYKYPKCFVREKERGYERTTIGIDNIQTKDNQGMSRTEIILYVIIVVLVIAIIFIICCCCCFCRRQRTWTIQTCPSFPLQRRRQSQRPGHRNKRGTQRDLLTKDGQSFDMVQHGKYLQRNDHSTSATTQFVNHQQSNFSERPLLSSAQTSMLNHAHGDRQQLLAHQECLYSTEALCCPINVFSHLKNELLRQNRMMSETIPLHPIRPEMACPLRDIYVERQTEEHHKNKGMLEDDPFVSTCKVFLLGQAGRGKTTCCLHFLHMWCSQYQTNFMTKYDYAFYLPAPILRRDFTSIDEYICESYSFDDSMRGTVIKVLQKRKYRCLIILDGIDEMSSKLYNLCTSSLKLRTSQNNQFFLTSRYWVVEENRHIIDSYDRVYSLKPLKEYDIEQIAKAISNHLLKTAVMPRTKQSRFVLKKTMNDDERSLLDVPILATALITECYLETKSDQTLSSIVWDIIEMMLNKAESSTTEKCCTTQLSWTMYDMRAIMDKIKNRICCLCNLDLLVNLGSLANETQHDHIISSKRLFLKLGENDARKALKSGLIDKRKSESGFHDYRSEIVFFHDHVEEALLNLWHEISDTSNTEPSLPKSDDSRIVEGEESEECLFGEGKSTLETRPEKCTSYHTKKQTPQSIHQYPSTVEFYLKGGVYDEITTTKKIWTDEYW